MHSKRNGSVYVAYDTGGGGQGSWNDGPCGDGLLCLKWTSELYALQAVAEGVSGVIVAGAMYMVGCAPYWYTQLELTMVIEVRHVLWSGLQLEEISATNKLPLACNRLDMAWKRAVKRTAQEDEAIVEEAGRCVRLEFSKDKDSNDVEDDESASEVKSDGDDNSLN